MTPDEELAALRRMADLEADIQTSKDSSRKTIGETLLKGGKQVLRGAGNAAAFMLERGGLGMGQPEPPDAKNWFGGPTLSQALRQYLNKNLPEEPGIGNAALRGAGGGMPNPRMMVPGAAGSTAAEAVKEFVPDDGKLGKVKPALETGAAMLASGVTGYAAGPRNTANPVEQAKRDTGILTQTALDRVGPPTSGIDAANAVENAATKYFKEARNNRTDMFGAMVEGEKVSKFQLANIYRTAKQAAESIAKTGRGEQADAMMEAANRLVTGDQKTFITDLQQLSLSLKNLKDNPPSLNAATGRQISSKDISDSVKALESALESVAPKLAGANKVYQNVSRQIDTAATGPLGKLTDKTPYNPDPAVPGKVDATVAGSDPRQIVQTMAALKATGADPQAIARALLDKKLHTGPMMPGQKVFGGQGSGQENQISTLLQTGGVNPQGVKAPLEIADRIGANLKESSALREYLKLDANPPGIVGRMVLQPGAFARHQETGAINKELTKLLKTATPAEIEQLKKLSMFDPKLRMAFTLMGMGQGTLQQEKE